MQLKDKIGIFINCRDNPVKAQQGVKDKNGGRDVSHNIP